MRMLLTVLAIGCAGHLIHKIIPPGWAFYLGTLWGIVVTAVFYALKRVEDRRRERPHIV
jgi:hypothetical protein